VSPIVLKRVSAPAQAWARLCYSLLRVVLSYATNAAAFAVRTFASFAPSVIKFIIVIVIVRTA